MSPPASASEWLESDSSGGFASGTIAGYRTRRYHALLLWPRNPPSDRLVLVNGFEAWAESPHGTFALSTQCYSTGIIHPRGLDHLVGFTPRPWPTWTFRGPAGIEIVHECLVGRVDGAVMLSWHLAAGACATLYVRPLLSGRDYHSLMHENPAFNFAADVGESCVSWHPYEQIPSITAHANGIYRHEPVWYRNFHYCEEEARGLDHLEDLASPGVFAFELKRGDANLVLSCGNVLATDAETFARRIRASEQERRAARAPLDLAADSYIVRRAGGHTIIAGYPWFLDWGRDTFIAMRGLCIARGRSDVCSTILLAWSRFISQGMLPNRFPDGDAAPEYNSVDASLWYVIAAQETLAAFTPAAQIADALRGASRKILDGYAAGTRYGIRMDDDGLLACGEPGVSLTWMDARIGDHAVTPRIGKPVEVQALWINALRLAGGHYTEMAERAQCAFGQRYWNASDSCLYDVVDVDHEPGRVDASVRPNQIFAAGGLPHVILGEQVARAVVGTVERELLTPMGLRSLSPRDPAYRPAYLGSAAQRDAAYHQGTAWPWLVGPFVDAWLNVHGDDAPGRAHARRRFLDPLLAQFNAAGLGHAWEIADADAPHMPRGCPFQAWSLGELIRSLARTAPNAHARKSA